MRDKIYFFFRQYGLYFLLSIILIVAIAYKIQTNKKNQNPEFLPVDGSEDNTPVTPTKKPVPSGTGGGTTTVPTGVPPSQVFNFNANKECIVLRALLENGLDLLGQDITAFNKILAYTNTQLKQVATEWKKLYIATSYPNLYSMVQAEQNFLVDSLEFKTKKEACLKRLKSLGF